MNIICHNLQSVWNGASALWASICLPLFYRNEEKAQTSWAGVDNVLCKSEQMHIETSKPAVMCRLLQVITADNRRSGKSSCSGL